MMYQCLCEEVGRTAKKSQDEDEPLALNLAKKPRVHYSMLRAPTGESDSLPSLGGLGIESRDNSGNSEQKIAAEANRPNDVLPETQNYSQSESEDETGGSDDEKSDDKADEKEIHE